MNEEEVGRPRVKEEAGEKRRDERRLGKYKEKRAPPDELSRRRGTSRGTPEISLS